MNSTCIILIGTVSAVGVVGITAGIIVAVTVSSSDGEEETKTTFKQEPTEPAVKATGEEITQTTAATTATTEKTTTDDSLAPEVLFWSEEFDALDDQVWQHIVTAWRGGNHEFQYYRNDRKNSYIKDGILYIKPTLTADEYGNDFIYNGNLDLYDAGCGYDMDINGGCNISAGENDAIINPIQSARIRSNIGFSFKYGRAEVRAQMPKGDWLWPAIWMLPTDKTYGYWPKSGEIDIVESKGNERLLCYGHNFGHQKMGSAMHWGPDWSQNKFSLTEWSKRNETHPFGDHYHIYEVNWTETNISFSVDGEVIGSVSPPSGGFWELGEFNGDNLWVNGDRMAPFDQVFHFVINVAVGGNFFWDDGCTNENGAKPWTGQNTPGAMKSFWEAKDDWYHTWHGEDIALKVDYIRVYQKNPILD